MAVAKLAFGYATGAVSIISDGFHSLTDGASNVMGIVGLRAARKPPDEDHPYGHRKYETLAAAGIFVFLLLVVVEVVRAALDAAARRAAPDVTLASFGVMLVTLGGQPARGPLRVGARARARTASCCWPTRRIRRATC